MKTLAVISDLHSNSTVGLAPLNIKLDDGDNVGAGTVRRWLWYRYQEILEQIEKEKKGDLYGVINGDAVELDAKNRSQQVITRKTTEAVEIANETLEPFFKMCKGVYVERGTEAHVGASGEAEEAIAKNFDNAIHNEETGTASWWYLPLIFDGVKMDIAHHPKGGGGGRLATKQNLINRIAFDTQSEYAQEGQVPPKLVIRSHLHNYQDSWNAYRTRAIITPAMSLLTAYGHRIGLNTDNDIGAIMIYCHNGEYFVKPITKKVPRPQWVVM